MPDPRIEARNAANRAEASARRKEDRAAEKADPSLKYGSTAFIDKYFPEYSSTGQTGAGAGQTGLRHVTAPWRAPGIREATQGMSETEKVAFFDNHNWHRSGNSGFGIPGVDPGAIKGARETGPSTGVFRLPDGGTLTRSRKPTRQNPYGENATISGGKFSGWSDNSMGTVLENPATGGKYVKGWATRGGTAFFIRDSSYRPAGNQGGRFWTSPPPPWMNEAVGTSITGKYGWPQGHNNFTGFQPNQVPAGQPWPGDPTRGASTPPPPPGTIPPPTTPPPGGGGTPPGPTPPPGGGGPPVPPPVAPQPPPTQFDPLPLPTGPDPYGGQPRESGGHPGVPYARPIFGGPNQAQNAFDSLFNSVGINAADQGNIGDVVSGGGGEVPPDGSTPQVVSPNYQNAVDRYLGGRR
jgi:hypothetical protein